MFLNDFTFESASTNPMYGPSLDSLLRGGAKRADLIVDLKEWYRLLLPLVLHGG